jgi:hypothetical protein
MRARQLVYTGSIIGDAGFVKGKFFGEFFGESPYLFSGSWTASGCAQSNCA